MAESGKSRLPSILTGLRGLVMLLAGLYAIVFPGPALAILVVAGGIIFLVDGVFGLWSITFGGAKTGNFWFDVVRNVLSILTGLLVLLSPILATLVTVWFFIYLVAFQAIFVGVMEIMVILREREMYAKIWPVLLSGVMYVLFGIVMIIAPLMSAFVLVVLAGILMVVFSVGLFGWAMRLYKAGH
ncbi:Uncharacterized membrane protein HdeD, DUF308 family [Devosia enhydra]|uniref:Uncharacterized membrane protein HdeD, DUF308 family n=1 Tax=Devosia enhydra TaxID=665118 RepID=A0A1K2HV05_9HYPH|nr:DUF308 domain-containing protein [Devosia enhydra]SFZ82251.1 Uncharacterized membrane protein HdeD, DUF308 family [Devosia enhydra]